VKIVAGVLTRNAVTTGRLELAKDCVRSLAAEADEVIVWDNGSTDTTSKWVETIGGHLYQPDDNITTSGRGMNMLGSACAARGDIVVLTSDDMFWRPGWRKVLEDFWTGAPDAIKILCGLLEPEYPWSVPVGKITINGVTGLLRPSVPGSGWTFRSADWPTIGPVPEVAGHDDVPTCRRLVAAGGVLVAVDIADHRGEYLSTWGNVSHRYARPLSCDTSDVTRVGDEPSNVGLWDHHYDTDVPGRYADDTTYKAAAQWLSGLAVEDWGCGFATFSEFHDGPYVGVDGSGKWCDVRDDLATRQSATPGLLLRHVLDHNYQWQSVLDNAVASFLTRMAIVLFTPLQDETRVLNVHQFGVPNIGFKLSDVTDRLVGCDFEIEHFQTDSEFGVETLIKVWRTMQADDATSNSEDVA